MVCNKCKEYIKSKIKDMSENNNKIKSYNDMILDNINDIQIKFDNFKSKFSNLENENNKLKEEIKYLKSLLNN
tara:strand:+ start:101 stop:319 length:219 start_codon:yes stop_codon:yes gene_type:complete